MKSNLLYILFGLGMLACTSNAPAQAYSIDWHTIDGGGGMSASMAFSVNGTIGQPTASTMMAGGGFSLEGGFWSITALQTLDGPLLKVFLTASNTAVISWPSSSADFVLQQNGSLSSTNWVPAGEVQNVQGTNRFILVNPHPGNRFYRLFKP